jgi:hypothetical protein
MYCFYVMTNNKLGCKYMGNDISIENVPSKHMMEVINHLDDLVCNGIWKTSV